jgi:hypothetical protein
MIEEMGNAQEGRQPPPCMIYVDKEGAWFHNGVPITHRELILLFYESLSVDEGENYIIKFKNQVCRLDVEDTPFVVLRTDFIRGGNEAEIDRFVLHLTDDSKEDLDPETLFFAPNHVLYCKIREGRFKARFSRPGYYQLAEYVKEEAGAGLYFLSLNNKKYYLRKTSQK